MSAEVVRSHYLLGRFPSTILEAMERTSRYKPPAPTSNNSNQLTVISLDLLKSKTGLNRKEHHTDRYDSNNLIVRRGQTFQMWIEFSRPIDPKKDKIELEFRLGPLPILSKGTLVTVLVDEQHQNCWGAETIERCGSKVRLSVTPPASAHIGRYELAIKTTSPHGISSSANKPENDVYMLFNPWCKDDSVYLDDEGERNEYVLNDVGKLYYGTENQIGERTWNFGQFVQGVLEACLFVLERNQSFVAGWENPANIVRVVSAMVNSPDDGGVLEGNWSNNYADGTSPTAWSGSVDILKQYHESKGSSVKYGQCWVFSGVTTTVLRCLGIPTRSVTNFSSAHDTDNSLTIDVYLDENLRPIEKLNHDSIWNFHVWNESWMSRPDLPDGMGGWQVVDATPQETSLGFFRCGPTPVAAIREGQVFLKYDAPFVFAEVNSDRIYWQRNSDGVLTQIDCEKNVVGRCISTKAVGSDKREDITNLYKYPEGSERERICVETASLYGSKPNAYCPSKIKDVTVKVSVTKEGPQVGEDAKLFITTRNDSSESRSATLYLQVAVMYYTGVLKSTIKQDQLTVKLKPKEVQTQVWTLVYEDYRGKLVDHAALLLNVSGRVSETKQVLATQFNFRMRTPNLDIVPAGGAVVGKEMSATIKFKNPLQRVLTNVRFRIEGLGLLLTRDIAFNDVASRGSVTLAVKFSPTLPGPRKLLATLDSLQLRQVHGFVDVDVKEK